MYRRCSGLDDYVIVLDVHRERFGHIRTLGERFTVLDHHRIGPDLESPGVEVQVEERAEWEKRALPDIQNDKESLTVIYDSTAKSA